ncbi:MAG: tRNA (adenosine(37)-N6)-dimethylallyltransferase MiaA [Deltaproteobacteria bacterium]|nr:tRNA (adenosine(37)-N6)-dimethylallyltransferase MiaA [Deltaproteobacteria bacterium]MBI2228808.1 tRNA (adenosine(37)-N6)-dimethylallyltransferase MiaA [Deltaproteobacteria bacterium]
MKPKLVIILGPTAVGKSEVAMKLAGVIGAEIINADSQQVYRYMNIGTGKPSRADRERVAHHLIDVVDPDEEFNVAIFRRLALETIDHIHARGKHVVVCGGTGLYLKALTRGLFVGPEQNPEVRNELAREIQEKGLGALYQRLIEIDPAAHSRIHPNDRQRIVRALEVYRLTGKPMSQWQREHDFGDERFDTFKIGLQRERAELYDRINRRCDRMIGEGLLEEVRGLAAKGYSLDLKPLQSVGYRQMGLVLQGMLKIEQAVEEMKQETRHLAKRQLTWFRQDQQIRWLHPESEKEEIRRAAESFLRP